MEKMIKELVEEKSNLLQECKQEGEGTTNEVTQYFFGYVNALKDLKQLTDVEVTGIIHTFLNEIMMY